MSGSSKNQNASEDPSASDRNNWVDPEVLRIQSTIVDDKKLKNAIAYANLLQANTVSYRACNKSDRVCQSRVEEEEEYFYVYETFFTRLGLRLPFSDFQAGILNRVNVAPTQLHPNSWAFVRCFELLCDSCNLIPTISTFFYFFQLVGHKKNNMSWVYLHGRKGRRILKVFDQSYKNFKDRFFRAQGSQSSTPFFLNESNRPKFPLYWCKSVVCPDPPDFSSLSDSEQTLVKKLEQKGPSSCVDLIRRSVVHMNSDTASENYLNAELVDVDDSEAEELTEQAPMKKQKVTHGAMKQRNKQKISVENSPCSTPEHTPSVANPIVEFQHLHAFQGEGRIASLWDPRYDFDHHVREHLYFCSDQDKLRRAGHGEVGRFVTTSALRMASCAQFLVQEVEMLRKDVNGYIEENHMMQSKVSQLASEVEAEKSARLLAEGQLCEEKIARNKCEEGLVRNQKEAEFTERRLVRELKKSVTESFQNALEQISLGFPDLNLTSITLDPFKVVEGHQLVDRRSGPY